jgi:hypothetical protein
LSVIHPEFKRSNQRGYLWISFSRSASPEKLNLLGYMWISGQTSGESWEYNFLI